MTSIKENVIQGLKSNLEAIDGTGDYANEVPAAQIYTHPLNIKNVDDRPVIVIHEQNEDYDDGVNFFLTRTARFTLEAWKRIDPGVEDAGAESREWLADIERAIQADTTLGGTAINTKLVSNDAVAFGTESPDVGALVQLEIMYRTAAQDPAASFPS